MTTDELLFDENRDELLERLRSDAARIHQLEANFAWIESERAQTQRERDQLREQVATLNANVDTFLAELDQARDQRDKAEDDLGRSLAAWESAGMQGRDAQQAMLRLQARIEAQDRELDRWRHGVPIEGDYVCEYAMKLDEALKEREEARVRWVKDLDEARLETERWKAKVLPMRDEYDATRTRQGRHICELKMDLAKARVERDEAKGDLSAAFAERDRAVAERDDAVRERDEARTELAGLADALDDIRHQRDRYHAELKQERQEVERLRKGLEPIADGTVWNAKESAEFLLRRKP